MVRLRPRRVLPEQGVEVGGAEVAVAGVGAPPLAPGEAHPALDVDGGFEEDVPALGEELAGWRGVERMAWDVGGWCSYD